MSFYLIAPMGKGKTLFTTIFAKRYSELNPDNRIFANYHLKLPNFYFTPFMFLPLSELHNCLIICDDVYALSNVNRFTGIVANLSRKKDITIGITAQYYTMITPNLRTLLPFAIYPEFDKENKTLIYYVKEQDDLEYTEFEIENPLEYVKDVYDTTEIVLFPTEENIIDEICKFSNTLDDIDLNIELFTKNRTYKKQLKKEVLARKDYASASKKKRVIKAD